MFRNLISSAALWVRCLKVMSATDAFRLIYNSRTRAGEAYGMLSEVKLKNVGSVYVRKGTSDFEILRQIFISGEYELHHLDQFLNIKSKFKSSYDHGEKPLIIDCGANIGLSARYFSSIFPEATVVAIEPAEDNFLVARQNLGPQSNVSLIHAAICSRSKKLYISRDGREAWAYTTSPKKEVLHCEEVEGITINGICETWQTNGPLLVKIDIEGAESDLFSENLEWMDRTSLLIIELHDWLFPNMETSKSFFRALEGRSFEIAIKGENLIVFFSTRADRNPT